MPTSGSRHPLPAWNHSDRLAKNEKKQTRLETWTSNTETLTSFWNCPALPCPALPCPALPLPALPCPAALPCPCPCPWPCPLPSPLPCPALPTLPCRAGLRTSSSPTGGQVVCWKPLLFVERPAQAARTHNPHPSISAVLGCAMWLFMRRMAKRSREQESPPSGGFGG